MNNLVQIRCYLEQKSAFYGEFSLCGGTKVGKVGPEKLYLRCANTDTSVGVGLKLKTEDLMNGKLCVGVNKIGRLTDGDCSTKAEVSFFK